MGVEFKAVILKCQNYDNIKRIAILCDWHADETDSLRENADETDFIFFRLSGVEALIANLCGFSMRSFDFAQDNTKKTSVEV